MTKYNEFKEIIRTMEAHNYDWHQEIQKIEQAQEKRKGMTEFSLAAHVKAMVYAMLSNNRPWKKIEENSEKVDAIFHEFDVDYLLTASPEELEQKLKEIKCGNRQIKNQMLNLSGTLKNMGICTRFSLWTMEFPGRLFKDRIFSGCREWRRTERSGRSS